MEEEEHILRNVVENKKICPTNKTQYHYEDAKRFRLPTTQWREEVGQDVDVDSHS